MAQLSMEQLASLARQVGFKEEDVPRMVATAMAESGGNPRAHNPNASTGDNSYGLLQVNMLGRMGDERRKSFGLPSNEALFDPLTNFGVAKKIYDSQGIGAWGAWTNGSAAKFLDAARRASGSPQAAAGAFTFNGARPQTVDLGGGDALAPDLAAWSSKPRGDGAALGAALLGGLGGQRFAGSGVLGRAAARVAAVPARGFAALPDLGAALADLEPPVGSGLTPGAGVAGSPAAKAPLSGAPRAGSSGIRAYVQGGWGPGGADHFGPHFDIKGVDQKFFDRNALDAFVQVNGKPLSTGFTVSGGEFGASRDGGARRHAGWDYAFGDGATLTLTGGAQWLNSQAGDYGDAAVFRTPDGRQFRILHGRVQAG